MKTFTSLLRRKRVIFQAAAFAGFAVVSSLWTGCAEFSDPTLSLAQVSEMSPTPKAVDTSAAVRQAHAFVAAHPGSVIALGMGDSMLPLYRDGTMVVVERRPLNSLKPGMTIVFKSAEGWSVAHALVEKTSDGWVTMGIHNPEPDGALVTDQNYVGVVVRAYELPENPMFALASALGRQDTAVAMVKPGLSAAVAALTR
jgi:signal peptidase I